MLSVVSMVVIDNNLLATSNLWKPNPVDVSDSVTGSSAPAALSVLR